MKFIDAAKDEANNNNGRDYPWFNLDFDRSDATWLKLNPTTFVTWTFPEYDEGNPLQRSLGNEEYRQTDRGDQGYPIWVADDPEVVRDEEQGTDNSIILDVEGKDEYRVFNGDDDRTDKEDMGVVFDDTIYRGEVVDSLDVDRVVMSITSTAGQNVAKRLDCCGDVAAGMDPETGSPNDGLVEYVPDDVANEDGVDEDGIWSRYARNPELREDLLGERVGLLTAWREDMKEDYSGDAYWFSVFDMETGEIVKATDEGRPRVSREDDDGDTWNNRTFLYPDWGQFDPNIGDGNDSEELPPKQQEFAEWCASEGHTNAEDVREAVSQNEEEFEEEANVDGIVEEVMAQA